MGYTLTDKIFGFFGVNAKVKDTFKDGSGKGINERYHQGFGEDYDENVRVLIDDFHDNLYVPKKCQSKFIEFLEYNLGRPIIVFETDSFRRKMLELHHNITLIKGTLLSHEVLFKMLGMTTVVITLVERISGFDSSITLDDDTRRFDGTLLCCQHYTIALTGGSLQNDTLDASILRIALYLKPIDAEIDSITYNGNPVPLE